VQGVDCNTHKNERAEKVSNCHVSTPCMVLQHILSAVIDRMLIILEYNK
jgi:hypothetical protein